MTTVRVASGLARPVFVTHVPGDYERVWIIEQRGKIKLMKNGVVLPEPFLDLTGIVSPSGNERGLLGLAFHPDYADNGYFYVNYTMASGGDTVVARYQVSPDADLADDTSAMTLLTVDQPYSNHNGGWIDFGPDGYLYISLGDGGSGNDPGNRAQDITNQLLGKMLRIDIDGDDFPADPNRNYAIPADNPFAGIEGDDEIWAYGLRNAWRNSFDRDTGDLWIADVGQGAWEEVDFQPAGSAGGENYGWRCMEGNHCTGLAGCDCFDNALTDPIHEYSHAEGCSITGGYVYRGCTIPDLHGTYFFADYCSDIILSLQYDGQNVFNFQDRTAELAPGGGLVINSISAFGEDAYGEIYICDLGGEVFKIVPADGITDCNENGVDDACDIAAGTSDDVNHNGIPDECECVGDLDGDGSTGQADLGILLADWGCTGGGCSGDLDNDGDTDQADLGVLLADWNCSP